MTPPDASKGRLVESILAQRPSCSKPTGEVGWGRQSARRISTVVKTRRGSRSAAGCGNVAMNHRLDEPSAGCLRRRTKSSRARGNAAPEVNRDCFDAVVI